MPTLAALSHYKVSGQFGVWLCSLLWLFFGTCCHPASIPSNIYSMHASFIQHLYHKYLVATESSQNAKEGFVCSSSWVALLEHFSGGVSASLKMSLSWLSYLWAVYIEVSEINTELQLLFACELVSKMITRYSKYAWHVEMYFQLQWLPIASK